MLDKNTPRIVFVATLAASLLGCISPARKIATSASQETTGVSYASSTPRHWDIPHKPFPAINGEITFAGGDVPPLHEARRRAQEPNASAQTRYYYGIALYRVGNYEDAVAVFRALIPDNPEQEGLYKCAGYALLGTGDLKSAAAMFGHFGAMKDVSSQNRARAFNEQGNCLWEMGRFKDAAVAYKNDLALDPGSVASLMTLTDIALRQGDKEQAKRYLMRLSKLPMRTKKNQNILAQLHHRLKTGT